MNPAQLPAILRFFLILAVQVLVLRTVSANVPNLEIYVYPLAILLLPLKTPHWALLMAAFFLGIMVDAFYDSPGIHTSAMLFTAFLRPYLCRGMEPRGGYEAAQTPTKHSMGIEWFLQYTGILLFVHIFIYFIVNTLSFNLSVSLRIVYCYLVTMVLIILYAYLFNPKR